MAVAQGWVTDPETFTRRQAEYPDFALMEIAMDVECRLRGGLERICLREGRMDQAAGDQIVRRPRLGVIREVGADDALEVHPEVAVVVAVLVARGGRAGHDRAAAPGDV